MAWWNSLDAVRSVATWTTFVAAIAGLLAAVFGFAAIAGLLAAAFGFAAVVCGMRASRLGDAQSEIKAAEIESAIRFGLPRDLPKET